MNKRVPVVYKGKPLMPTTWSKARRLMKEGKAILVKDKIVGVYLKLKFKPSGEDTQDCVLGIDPGTSYNGYSVVTKGFNNLNIQQNTLNAQYIKKDVAFRRLNRRDRRNLLRHRKCKNKSRTGKRMNKVTHYYTQSCIQMIKYINKIYPINVIVKENVSLNHYINQSSTFSNVEVGKNTIRTWINNNGYRYLEYEGYDTYELRNYLFKRDPKVIDKSVTSIYSHCVDSIVLSLLYLISKYSINNVKIDFDESLRVLCKVRNIMRVRRLRVSRSYYGDGAYFFRYGKGGIKKYINKYTKLRKTRYKPEDQKSNHGPWVYIYPTIVEYWKYDYSIYGGSFDRYGYKRFYDYDHKKYRYYDIYDQNNKLVA